MERAELGTFVVCVHPVHLDDEETLYFEEQEDLESDSWRISGKSEVSQIFRNQDNLVLIAQPGDDEDLQAIFDHVTDKELKTIPGIRFNIHSYLDSKPRGLSVAFTVQWDRKTYHMYVEERENKMRVKFKEGNIPEDIEGENSNVVFIKKRFSEGSRQFFRFESTLKRGYFLAFEREDRAQPTRLIIKKMEQKDEVDESTKLHHARKSFSDEDEVEIPN